MTTDRTPAELLDAVIIRDGLDHDMGDRAAFAQTLVDRRFLLAQLAEQRSINAALVEALRALFDTGAWHVASDDDGQETDNVECWYCAAQAPDDGNPDPEHAPRCTWVAARAILADPSKAATEWRTQVAKEAVEEITKVALAVCNDPAWTYEDRRRLAPLAWLVAPEELPSVN